MTRGPMQSKKRKYHHVKKVKDMTQKQKPQNYHKTTSTKEEMVDSYHEQQKQADKINQSAEILLTKVQLYVN